MTSQAVCIRDERLSRSTTDIETDGKKTAL